MKRVLYVSPVGDVGGAERVLVNLVRFQDRTRFAPEVALLKGGSLVDELARSGARLSVFPTTRLRSLSSVAAVRSLRRLILAHQVDVVVGNMSMGHLYGGLAALGTPARAVWFQHGIVERPDAVDRLAAMVPAALTFVPSVAARETQRRLGGRTPVHVVPAGVDLDAFDPAAVERGCVRQELGIDRDAPVVATMGRLQRSKGHSLFLDVATRIHLQVPSAHFIVAGGTICGLEEDYAHELARDAERLLPGRVHLLGHRDDVPAILRDSDVMIHCPIGPESFGLVILEAMLMERPVVGVRAWGPAEIVVHGETGMLVEPGDAAAFAREAIGLLDDRPRSERMGRAGRARVRKTFSAQSMVTGVEHELDRLMTEGAAR